MSIGKFKRVLKEVIPPFLLVLMHRIRGRGIRYLGHFASWDAAGSHAVGYDADNILERVATAIVKVQSGEAVYERDSVIFSRIEYSFPLLAALLKAAAERGGNLRVLDFGGSLGSSYFQCRGFLEDVKELTWCVVEQENFVARGRAQFASDQLFFFSSMDECLQDGHADVLLFASVLQYLSDYEVQVRRAVDSGVRYIVIDRTPFSQEAKDWLCIQYVPSDIYAASYPCNILSKSKLMALLESEFELLGAFDSIGGRDRVYAGMSNWPFNYEGMIWRRR